MFSRLADVDAGVRRAPDRAVLDQHVGAEDGVEPVAAVGLLRPAGPLGADVAEDDPLRPADLDRVAPGVLDGQVLERDLVLLVTSSPSPPVPCPWFLKLRIVLSGPWPRIVTSLTSSESVEAKSNWPAPNSMTSPGLALISAVWACFGASGPASIRVVFPEWDAFHGHVSDVRGIWYDNHLLVLPSRCEGTPISLVEAMIWGHPAVVTGVGGNAEWVTEPERVPGRGSQREVGRRRDGAGLGCSRSLAGAGSHVHVDATALFDPAAERTLLQMLVNPRISDPHSLGAAVASST